MAANDLKKPLGKPKKGSKPGETGKKSFRPSQLFMYGSIGLLTTFIVGLVVWIIIVDDPYGGYETMHVDLSASLGDGTKIGVDAIRPGIKPGIPDTTVPDEKSSVGSELFPETSFDPQVEHEDNIRILDPSLPVLNHERSSGEAAFKTYARPINSDAIAGLPKIAIVIDGLGLSQSTTQEALSLLPPDITLAFAPYGNSLNRWTQKARNQGHELLIQVPMEPFDYPDNDPGPHTLLTSTSADNNTANFNWILGRFDFYVGVMNYMGARFSTDELAGSEFMREVQANGLLYLESGITARSRLNVLASNMGVPNLSADLVLDAQGQASDIETRLIQLETIAQDRGIALGVASAFPNSIRVISEWTQSLRQRGFALVPVTTLLSQ